MRLDKSNISVQGAAVPWSAVLVFGIAAYGLAWLIALPFWLPGIDDSKFHWLSSVLPSVMMISPLIATGIVVFGFRIPRTVLLRFLGLWPLKPAKRVVWFAVAATLGPLLIVLLCIGVSSALGWVHLDLAGLSGLQSQLRSNLSSHELQMILLTQIAIVPFAAIFNGILTFGEEIGWRGWLLPVLRPLGVWPALLISGAIWGLWHAPVTLLGHNFNEPNLGGVALMTIGCIVWGVVFGWLRLRSGSLWPAVLAHGSLNASAGLVLVVGSADDSMNLALINPLGVSGWIVLTVVILIIELLGQFKKEPPLR